ncbi:hypothetical protein ACOME3_002486 [Neoechinorhynchus agilis]
MISMDNCAIKGLMSTEDMMFVFGCLMFAAMGVGQIQAMAPDQGKATAAAVKVHKVLSRKPEIDSMSTDGIEIDHFNGDIKFQNVDFEYPTREGVPVLRSMNIHIPSSRSIALVGSSGSGKSTVLQLLERYYDPVNGNILIDGHNLRDLNIKSYRKKLGFVGQEPVLFDWSIAENIAFGDTDRQVTIEEIRAAAQTCNIDSFVSELPDGYDTRVGAKGSLISGGQKQRICIARAIIRNPKLLLLDEATSALDTESEKMVQAALEEAQKGRGSISIAHRLRTIEDCDDIFVMDKGKITESGTHQELISKESLYSELYKLSTI